MTNDTDRRFRDHYKHLVFEPTEQQNKDKEMGKTTEITLSYH